MDNLYATIYQELDIEQEVFDRIISDEGARNQICECLYYCLMNVPALGEVSSVLLQYIAQNRNNYDEEEKWITVNGTPVLLDDEGKATNGGKLKGMDFSNAESETTESSSSESSGGERSCKDFIPEGSFSTKRKDYVSEVDGARVSDLDPSEQKDAWEQINIDKLKELYKDERKKAKDAGQKPPSASEVVDREWFGSRTEEVTKGLRKVSDTEADEVLYDAIGESAFRGWFRNADSAYKPRVINGIISSPEARNAALSIMHDNYRALTGNETSFDEWLTTPVKMYRGGHGQKHTTDDVFSAYSFSREVAENFAGEGGKIYEAEIRPVDTWGSVSTNKESEIMVPSWIAPNQNQDRADSANRHISILSPHDLQDRLVGIYVNGAKTQVKMDGGPGSGYKDHPGRPGEVGGSSPGNASRKVAQGSDISATYKGSTKTKDVIHAQGFDGLPKVVSKEEFDEAVKASKFVAQRTYAASSQEILDSYRSQLYDGDFYVDCEVGGAQYGQGMYCAADYKGELTDAIAEEMDHYRKLGQERMANEAENHFVAGLTKEDFKNSPYSEGTEITDRELDVFRKLKSDPDMTGYRLPKDEQEVWKSMLDNGKWRDMSMGLDDLTENFRENYKAPSYTETLTLDPSAKSIKHSEIENLRKSYEETIKSVYHNRMKDLDEIMDGDELVSLRDERDNKVREARKMDDGAIAAMYGYDVINAEGHGMSGSYTVILNRTKAIFLDEREHKDAEGDTVIHFQIGPDNVIYAIRDRKVIGTVETSVVVKKAENKDGGPGSGNFGHKGRPGEVGGSAPDGVDEGAKFLAEQITKRRANDTILEALSDGSSEDSRRTKVASVLEQLEPGSKIEMPESFNDDDGRPCILVRRYDDPSGEYYWEQTVGGEKYSFGSDDEVAGYFVSSYDYGELAKVTRSAMSEEAKRKAEEEWDKKYNWRANADIWKGEGSLLEHGKIKMQKFDLDNCGEGFMIVGSDGKTYIKDADGWVDGDTYEKADRRKFNNPEFTGDFFDINFGMNGVSKAECAKARVAYSNMPENLQKAYEERFRNATCTIDLNPEQPSHCDSLGDVHLDPGSSARTIFHEYGHSVDSYMESINGCPSSLMYRRDNHKSRDFEAMAKEIGFRTDGRGYFDVDYYGDNGHGWNDKRNKTYWEWAKKHEDIEGFENVSDAISALTGNSCGETLYGGHEARYWRSFNLQKHAEPRHIEYWAEFCQMKAFHQDEALALLKRVTPNLYAIAEQTYEEVIEHGGK